MYAVRSVIFQPEGVSIEYATESDVRESGLLLQHMLLVPATDVYAEELDAVVDSVMALLEKAFKEFEQEPPAELTEVADDTGPYDNPLDRGPLPPPPGQD